MKFSPSIIPKLNEAAAKVIFTVTLSLPALPQADRCVILIKIVSLRKSLTDNLPLMRQAHLFLLKCIFFLILPLMQFSCSGLLEEKTNKTSTSNLKHSNENLKEIISQARFDVDNVNIYINPDEYLGNIISTRGIFVEQKFIKEKDLKFVIVGSNNGQPAEFIVYLDHPLQKQNRINENVQVISTASAIRVFGRLTGLEEYITYDGVRKQLPVLEAIAIFYLDDREFKYPVWLNLLYE